VISVSWKSNLYIMFAAEFIVILGFSFIVPFIPLFIQELGTFNSDEIALWSGISLGVSSIALFLSGPVWGVISDRVGRKPMVMRALFGSAVVQTLAGLSPNIYVFVALRFLQGLFSGTVPAAQAMVASTTPRDRTSYAMGFLMVGVFCGNTIGPTIGAVLASTFGFRNSFFFASALQLIAGLLVLFFVKEDFHRPVKDSSLGDVWRLFAYKPVVTLLMTIFIIAISGQILQPVITLFIQALDTTGSASTYVGWAFTLLGITAAASALISGRLGKRFSIKKMLVISCLAVSLITICPLWVSTALQMVILWGILGLFQGGNSTSIASLVGLSLPVSQQGIAFGLSQSATSLGNGLGPIIGGWLVSLLGLRHVFPVSAGLFLLAALLIARFFKSTPKEPSSNPVKM
jgi:DHA1 family multidrug resistance protein-like MFS transporter